jgi:hypothetical protein
MVHIADNHKNLNVLTTLKTIKNKQNYVATYLAQIVVESPEQKKLIFLVLKERLEEAPFRI